MKVTNILPAKNQVLSITSEIDSNNCNFMSPATSATKDKTVVLVLSMNLRGNSIKVQRFQIDVDNTTTELCDSSHI